jgi:leucine-zipper-like transcriptional regulator 1
LLRWSRITSSNGIVPPPRSGAASVVACGKLFVFGGYGGGTGRLDDFWSFCFETLVWERVHVKSKQRPGCRENNGVVISGCFDRHGNNNTATIFLFGGYNGSAWLNDLWEFNIETSCWTCIQESSDPVADVAAAAVPVPPGDQDVSAVGRRSHINNDGPASSHYSSSNNSIVPSRRFGYVSVVHQGKLILWGGFDGSRWLNDMYVFDFAKKTWTEIPQDNTNNNNDQQIPSVRSCPAWAKDDNYVYIQGVMMASNANPTFGPVI